MHNLFNQDIDIKDQKIIYILSQNARQSYQNIAKKCNLSKDITNYRIKKLEQKGIIEGYKTVCSISKLDFLTYHLYLTLNWNKKTKEKIISNLKNNSAIRTIITHHGKYNLELVISAKNNQKCDEKLTEILSQLKEIMQEYIITISIKHFKEESLPFSFKELSINKVQKYKKYPLDQKDIKILKQITNNAKEKIYTIAKNINLSTDATIKRIKKLKQAQIIKKFVPKINYELLGFDTYEILMNIIPFDKTDTGKIQEFFYQQQNVIWAIKTMGNFNIAFYILSKDTKEIHKILDDLKDLLQNKVINYEILIREKSHKYSYLPDLKEIENNLTK